MEAAKSGPIIGYLFAILLFVISASLNAETVSFSTFRVELQDGWTHRIAGRDSERATIYSPDGKDTLEILTFHAPQSVSVDALRNMTNVDSSVPLIWQDWGDYSGYQHDYSEGGSFYRQWWLAKETEVLLIVHTSDAVSNDGQNDAINRMVNSLTAIN